MPATQIWNALEMSIKLRDELLRDRDIPYEYGLTLVVMPKRRVT